MTLLKTFFPLLFGFLSGKLINQTDLIMLGMIGQDEIAAFGVPNRVMIFDMIVALSLGPVVSVFVANEKQKDNRVIGYCMMFSLIVGVILILPGMLFYPLITDHMIQDARIKELSYFAVTLLTLAIPVRLADFVAVMTLHAIGGGKKIIYIESFTLILNFILNYLLMFEFQLGFKGCYISTFFCSLVSLLIMIWTLKKSSGCQKLFIMPDKDYLKSFLSKSSSELLRVCIYHLTGAATLFLVGKDKVILTAFSASSEVHHFLMISLIALMRSIAIVLSASNKETFRERFVEHHKSYKWAIFTVLVVSLLIFFNLNGIGEKIYSLRGPSLLWWNSYMSFATLSLCLLTFNSILLGGMQSLKEFATLTKLEFISKWVIYLPLVVYKSPNNMVWNFYHGTL